MRNNVIDHCGRGNYALCHALHAQWILSQIAFTRRAPFAVIAAHGSISSYTIMAVFGVIATINTVVA